MTGLAIANAIQMILFVQWLVRMFGELHTSMNSVSAVAYFSKGIPKEVTYPSLLIFSTYPPRK
jgi:hypothetical protein